MILENEANLAAVFERDFGQAETAKDIVTISIHRGIGAGVIANGRLYRGWHGMAGEIGRNLLVDNEGKLVKVEVDKCIGCGLCVAVCPTNAMYLSES